MVLYKIKNCWMHISFRSLTSQNNSATLHIAWFNLNTLLMPSLLHFRLWTRQLGLALMIFILERQVNFLDRWRALHILVSNVQQLSSNFLCFFLLSKYSSNRTIFAVLNPLRNFVAHYLKILIAKVANRQFLAVFNREIIGSYFVCGFLFS